MTGRDILASQGGKDDWLGKDDGGRALPEEVPDQRVDTCSTRRGQEPPPECLTQDDIAEISQAFPNRWKLLSQSAYPNLGLSASVGDTFDVGGSSKIGFLLTGGYKYGYQRYLQKVQEYPP